MGYFSNGHEGDLYQTEYCFRCKNWVEDGTNEPYMGCPVWDVHFLWNYDAVNNDIATKILNYLIPISDDGVYNEECRMFWPIKPK